MTKLPTLVSYIIIMMIFSGQVTDTGELYIMMCWVTTNVLISWASIDADLFNTSWDMLLTDVKTGEMYTIFIDIFL